MEYMSNNSLKKIALGLVILVVNLLIVFLVSIQSDGNITFEYNVNSSKKDIYQLFYTHDGNFGTYVIDEKYDNIGVEKTLSYMIPREATRLRLDLGESSAEVTISNVKVTYYDQSLDVRSLIDKDPGSMNDISSIKFLDNKIEVVSGGKDPFLTLNLNNIHYPLMKKVDNLKAIPIKIIMCLIVNLLAIMSIIKGSEIKVLFKELYNNRRLVLNLSKNDFKTKYAGSYLGITWAFVQPIVIVLIYWFVFQVGFKSAPMEDFPFLLFLIAGIVPWFFFNDALLNATNCFLEYSYLVKKVVPIL